MMENYYHAENMERLWHYQEGLDASKSYKRGVWLTRYRQSLDNRDLSIEAPIGASADCKKATKATTTK